MARYPGAVWKPITAPKGRQALTVHNRVNLHSTASGASSQHGYFNQTGIPDSHFHVAYNGTVEQYVDTSMRAFADLEGNDATVSIETQGVSASTGDEEWRPAQVAAIIKLVAWIIDTHNIEVKLASSSKVGSASKGLSWHRLGCDGNFPGLPSIQAGRIQRGGGMHYSSSLGKVCPGYKRITQIHRDVWPGVRAALNAAPTPSTEGFLMGLSQEEQDAVLWNAREIKKDTDALTALLLPTIADGNGAAPLDQILERDLNVDRRTLAAVEALTAAVAALDAKVTALTPPPAV